MTTHRSVLGVSVQDELPSNSATPSPSAQATEFQWGGKTIEDSSYCWDDMSGKESIQSCRSSLSSHTDSPLANRICYYDHGICTNGDFVIAIDPAFNSSQGQLAGVHHHAQSILNVIAGEIGEFVHEHSQRNDPPGSRANCKITIIIK